MSKGITEVDLCLKSIINFPQYPEAQPPPSTRRTAVHRIVSWIGVGARSVLSQKWPISLAASPIEHNFGSCFFNIQRTCTQHPTSFSHNPFASDVGRTASKHMRMHTHALMCAHARTRVRAHECAHACEDTHAHACVHTCARARAHVCTHAHTPGHRCPHALMHACTHARAHARRCTCTYARKHTCTNACMQAGMHARADEHKHAHVVALGEV